MQRTMPVARRGVMTALGCALFCMGAASAQAQAVPDAPLVLNAPLVLQPTSEADAPSQAVDTRGGVEAITATIFAGRAPWRPLPVMREEYERQWRHDYDHARRFMNNGERISAPNDRVYGPEMAVASAAVCTGMVAWLVSYPLAEAVTGEPLKVEKSGWRPSLNPVRARLGVVYRILW